jgi:hypothetical protein
LETISTLRFGQRAKTIKNVVKKTVVVSKQQLLKEIKDLKEKLGLALDLNMKYED